MARQQFNARLPQSTIDQIVALTQHGGYESQAHVVIIAIDRMYREEKHMATYINIDLETDDSLIGQSEDWTGINQDDSVAKFDQMLYDRLHKRYPDAEINIQTYALRTHVDTNIEPQHEVEDAVHHYINEIHNTDTWVVYENE